MNIAFYIARRYLFAKKSHNAINIISMVSVCGVVVATIAMICTLSVFNGFKGLTTTIFSVFDPELKITPVEGKVFDPTDIIKRLDEMPAIQLCCEVLQENALVRYGDRQMISALKGVDSSFHNLAMIDTAIIDGRFVLQEAEASYGVLGIGLAAMLGVNAAFAYPMEVNMPKRDETINLANPLTSLRKEYVFIGGVYHINQPVYDEGFMIVSLDLMRSMLNYDREVSALELKLAPGVDIAAVKEAINSSIGDGFAVQDRYEQQEATFRMVQIEKRISFLMLCFILVLALFNVLGSLAILMIEKEADVMKLRSMGANDRLVNRIFLFEGWMISLFGAIIGVVIGILLCGLQQRFGLISLGETAGTFIIDAYPVEIELNDVIIVFLTVVTLGFLAVLYPVHYLGRKWLNKRLVVCLLIPFLAVGCGGQKKEAANKEIAVTIEPLRFFADKIAGGDYKFFSLVPVGQSPESYDPSPREMIRAGQGIACFYLGRFAVEKSLVKAIKENNAGTYIRDLSEGLPTERLHTDGLSVGELHTGEAGESGHSGHSGVDPHIWSYFEGAKTISENIFKALSSLDTARSDFYASNYQNFTNELAALESSLHEQLDTLSRRGFVIYHPALTYFAKEFGLTQYSIEEDGKEPSPSSLKHLIEEAKKAEVKVVFVQMEFDRKHAEQIAKEIGANVVVINPLDYQWDEQMKLIAKALIRNGEID